MGKGVNKNRNTKRTIKFLSVCRDPKVVNQILRKADKSLVKGICNAAYNVSRGDIPLTRQRKRHFARYRQVFNKLTSSKIGLHQKRKSIQRGGGLVSTIVPILLSTVLTALGSRLFRQ